MKKILLTASCFLLMAHSTFAQVKILFDATEGQTAGNADWVIDADAHNVQYTGTGGLPVQVTSTVQQDNAQRIPTPAQSGITASTPETYWTGALSNWGIDMVKKGYAVETLPTFDSITYGNFSNPQDLSNYKVFIVDEPQFPFSAHTKLALMNFIHNGGGLFIISDHINASRTNNGWDARGVWEDFITHNPVSNTAFGFKLDSVNISPTSANVNPSLTDSIIHGPEGNCPGMQWHNGTTFTLYPAENSSITGDVFMGAVGNTGVMAGHGRYGSGKFAFEGDSSPADDGTGDRYGVASTGVYNGYTGDPTSAPSTEEETIIVNTTIWLATSNSATTLSATTTQTNISCNGGNNGSATVTPSGGTPAYTYSWSPSGGTAATATGLAAGTYTVTVKDAASSTQTASVTITQPLAISTTTTQTNVSCNGSNNGSANISATGGTPSFTYSWSPSGGTSATASGLAANTYTCTITDSKGCTATKSVIISQPSAITTTTTQTNVSCNGSSNGSANIFATGGTPGYTYSWSPSGGTSATASGLAANTYTCTITDSKGCTATKSVIITQPSAITATTTQTNVSCNGDNNGVASVAVSGGTAGYTYSWSSGGGNTASASGLAANTYTCTITDSKGCTSTESVVITQPLALTATTSSTNSSGSGINDGTASTNPSGGTSPYTYSWSPSGETTETATGLAGGIYTCTIIDANGCSIVETDTVNVSTGIAVLNGISSGISLYPNPSGNDVNIVVGSIKNHPVLYFYDILGQQVQAITIKNTQTIISKGTLQSGIYFYRLMNDFGMAGNGKLIIVK
ncbi:MAG: T9SS type A sorting domain-containing protein [Bacteroidia bacterium]